MDQEHNLSWIKITAFILSVIFVLAIIYNIIRLIKLNKKQLVEFAKIIIEEPPEERASRWDKIMKHMESNNSSDWHRAILGADTLVDDIFKAIGFKGDSFAERLAQVNPSQFKKLDELWTAHKVRNKIAHQTDYEITKNEVEQVLGLYEDVLKELEYL